MSTDRLPITLRVEASRNADVVLSKVAVFMARERVRREERRYYEIPLWRVFRRRRQASRILDAKVGLVSAESALREAERRRDAARGAA